MKKIAFFSLLFVTILAAMAFIRVDNEDVITCDDLSGVTVTKTAIHCTIQAYGNSSFTDIIAGNWLGNTIDVAHGGTGSNSVLGIIAMILPSQTGNSGKVLSNDGSGNLSWINPPAYSPTSHSIAAGARSFNTAYQVSTTVPVDIRVSFSISCTLSLTTGQSGEVYMEYSANGTSGWTLAGMIPSSSTGSLTIGLNTVQKGGGMLSTILPPGYYWRLRTSDVTGTPTYAFSGGVELY